MRSSSMLYDNESYVKVANRLIEETRRASTAFFIMQRGLKRMVYDIDEHMIKFYEIS